jgi:hypothetical protein
VVNPAPTPTTTPKNSCTMGTTTNYRSSSAVCGAQSVSQLADKPGHLSAVGNAMSANQHPHALPASPVRANRGQPATITFQAGSPARRSSISACLSTGESTICPSNANTPRSVCAAAKTLRAQSNFSSLGR